jgi:hypothetical protein
MKAYDLYGFKTKSLAEIKPVIEKALGIQLAAHENLNLGDYFRLDNEEGENFMLQMNFDPYEEELIEDDFPDYSVLFYVNVNSTNRGNEIEKKLMEGIPGIKLLRKEGL